MNLVNPKVTVRMSAYNHEAYVEQAILSIVNQTYQDFELLVIDDGSTDNTPKILERLSQEHGFYYERQENMGVTKTLNKLVGMAKGGYLCGLASDDITVPDRLEKQVAFLDANPDLAFVYGYAKYIDDLGRDLAELNQRPQRLEDGNIFKKLITRGVFFKPGTIMARRQLFEELGGYDESLLVEDYDWLLRVCKDRRVGYIHEPLIKYRIHDEQFTQHPKKKRVIFEAELKMVRKWLPSIAGWRLIYYRVPYWFSLLRGHSRRWCILFAFFCPLYFLKKNYLVQLAYFLGLKKEHRV